ncbi:hypothetical protein AAFF_G00261510 [Aldrovandia affinis]|uniref:Uncharacterized protein n=1 Tax=Aldrovandia affinis TaxID=143900 RepID=A0AAD7W367_9TELE|nr:hypothetical protein AAFF_G00261510 [Aldrovandia affinis]
MDGAAQCIVVLRVGRPVTSGASGPLSPFPALIHRDCHTPAPGLQCTQLASDSAPQPYRNLRVLLLLLSSSHHADVHSEHERGQGRHPCCFPVRGHAGAGQSHGETRAVHRRARERGPDDDVWR